MARNWLLMAARGIARLALIGAVVGAFIEAGRITKEARRDPYIVGVALVWLVASVGGMFQIVRGHR
jgi:hypothetical protein